MNLTGALMLCEYAVSQQPAPLALGKEGGLNLRVGHVIGQCVHQHDAGDLAVNLAQGGHIRQA